MFDPTPCSPVEGSEGQIYAKYHFTSYIFTAESVFLLRIEKYKAY